MSDFDMTWAKMDPDHVPPEVDATRPSVARVYDAILGGKDNFAVDRAVAAAAVKTMGDDGNGARLNRAALGRAVRYMIGQGVTQFLDLGSGLPTVQNTHQIAQTINPASRVVYVDNDPSVYLHGQALLADDASTTVVLADITTPDKLLAMEEVRGFLDFEKPVGLILNAVIHHVLDEEDPYGIVDRYKQAVVPGSYLQLTHFCDESPEARATPRCSSGASAGARCAAVRRSPGSSAASTWSRRASSSCPGGSPTPCRTRQSLAACSCSAASPASLSAGVKYSRAGRCPRHGGGRAPGRDPRARRPARPGPLPRPRP
jgi:hypothetical protein